MESMRRRYFGILRKGVVRRALSEWQACFVLISEPVIYTQAIADTHAAKAIKLLSQAVGKEPSTDIQSSAHSALEAVCERGQENDEHHTPRGEASAGKPGDAKQFEEELKWSARSAIAQVEEDLQIVGKGQGRESVEHPEQGRLGGGEAFIEGHGQERGGGGRDECD
jgi:hypothetical protein